ncbi:hypothetical protein QE152_g27057 [Popillia japonica]|uniref:Uncharacterized protein n=1 Tax=Popillia japonica TaxID=7064 RepID=A0AAW1JXD7_POPJA
MWCTLPKDEHPYSRSRHGSRERTRATEYESITERREASEFLIKVGKGKPRKDVPAFVDDTPDADIPVMRVVLVPYCQTITFTGNSPAARHRDKC